MASSERRGDDQSKEVTRVSRYTDILLSEQTGKFRSEALELV